jgi:hypothetical protein
VDGGNAQRQPGPARFHPRAGLTFSRRRCIGRWKAGCQSGAQAIAERVREHRRRRF